MSTPITASDVAHIDLKPTRQLIHVIHVMRICCSQNMVNPPFSVGSNQKGEGFVIFKIINNATDDLG